MGGEPRYKELRDLLKLRVEKVAPNRDHGLPYVALEHMKSGEPRITAYGNSSEATSTKSVFKSGDILFGRLRPYLRKCALAERDGLCVTDILALEPQDADPSYLCNLMHSDRVMGFANRCSIGTKMPRIGWEWLGAFSVRIHNNTDQKRIARLLDSVNAEFTAIPNLVGQLQLANEALSRNHLATSQDSTSTCRLGDLFGERRSGGLANLPILSVTRHHGLVRRDSFGRKVESDLTPEQHLLVRKGDIAYNMMRMWQGVSGYAECDGLVSPALCCSETHLLD